MSKKLMIEDLSKSGLTETDANKLKLKLLSATQMHQLCKKKVASYKIPYFDLAGRELSFYRAKFLEPITKFGVTQKQKYYQPVDSDVRLYFPPLLDWNEIAIDNQYRIVLTEGEKKAAKVCKEGEACIGLGGVWSFRSKKKKKALIDDFYEINWKKREVWIVFDSDLRQNTKVAQAMIALSKELSDLGAEVLVGCVPELEGNSKTGLDDYLAVRSWEQLEQEIELDEDARARALYKMNESVAIIESTAGIYNIKTLQFMKKDEFVGVKYAHESYTAVVYDKDGNSSMRQISTAQQWLKWPNRRTHADIGYFPGQPSITEDNKVNTWVGWGCEPKKGDITPWNMLMEFVFSNDIEFYRWFEMWLAYPIQNPGTKLHSCVLLWSLEQRIGKSFIGYIMGKIYGENYKEVDEEMLHGTYNHWAYRRQFILGDEITGSDKRRDVDKIKGMISRKTISISAKWQPHYEIIDCINYFFTSNRPDSFFVENTDQRIGVHEVIGKPMPREAYNMIDKWYRGDGPSYLFYHLLHEVDCSEFNPNEHAPMTSSKRDMMALSRGDIDIFVEELKEDPDSVLVYDGVRIDRDLFTVGEIVSLFDKDGSRHTTEIAMSKALRRSGFRQLPVTQTSVGAKRLWALRNSEYWMSAEHKDRVDNYDHSVIHSNRKKGAKFKDNNRANLKVVKGGSDD